MSDTFEAPEPFLPITNDPFHAYGGFINPEDPFKQYGGYRIDPLNPYIVQFHHKFAPLFTPMRYKIMEGGRGSMKSWAAARALIIISLIYKKRIVCAREHMNTIEDSVHRLLTDQIEAMGLSAWFYITKDKIQNVKGSTFRFVGLGDLKNAQSRTKIKSFEGIDIIWIEEAENISSTTWEILIPTIRRAGSEIWIVYNPHLATDATYQRFHEHPPDNAIQIVMNWSENPWMTPEMLMEKDHLFRVDAEAAEHVWNGKLKKYAEATIFKGKFVVESFEIPETTTRFFKGMDFGFSQDPTACVLAYITKEEDGDHLWIRHEAWKIGCELPDIGSAPQRPGFPPNKPGLIDKIPGIRAGSIFADAARPDIISYLRGKGYPVRAARKWAGSIEDGIMFLRSFTKIHIHTDCTHTKDEFNLYSFKVDRNNGEVLTDIIDAHNHIIDSLRYALDGYIKNRGHRDRWANFGANHQIPEIPGLRL